MRLIPGPNGGGEPPVPEGPDHLARLKGVVREQLGLAVDTPVVISELQCSEPGCPPVETVVAVLDEAGRTWKLPARRADVGPRDLRALIVEQPHGGQA